MTIPRWSEGIYIHFDDRRLLADVDRSTSLRAYASSFLLIYLFITLIVLQLP
jgi:hypothetical protein